MSVNMKDCWRMNLSTTREVASRRIVFNQSINQCLNTVMCGSLFESSNQSIDRTINQSTTRIVGLFFLNSVVSTAPFRQMKQGYLFFLLSTTKKFPVPLRRQIIRVHIVNSFQSSGTALLTVLLNLILIRRLHTVRDMPIRLDDISRARGRGMQRLRPV